MYGGKYFEWIIIYSALDIGVTKKKYFILHDKNIAPLCASEIVILNSSFDSKIYVDGDNISSVYYNLSSPTVNLNLNGYDSSGL